MNVTSAPSHSPGGWTPVPSDPARAMHSPPSANISKAPRAQIGEDVVGIAQSDRACPETVSIGFQQKDETLIVKTGDPGDREAGPAAFVQKAVKLMP